MIWCDYDRVAEPMCCVIMREHSSLTLKEEFYVVTM